MFFIVPIFFEIVFVVVFVTIIATIIRRARHHIITTSKLDDQMRSSENDVSSLEDVNLSNECQEIYCDYCGSKIDKDKKKCPSCGARIQK